MNHGIANVSAAQTAILHWLDKDLHQKMRNHTVPTAMASCSQNGATHVSSQLQVFIKFFLLFERIGKDVDWSVRFEGWLMDQHR